MDADYYKDEMARERRARLAAERLLEQKQAQLKESNHKLSQHAMSLSGQIVDQRKVLEQLQGENSEAAAKALRSSHKALAAERLLWDAIKSIEDGFAVFDAERKLIAANAPYLSLFKRAENVGPGVSLESILDLCIADQLIDLDGKSDDEWYDFMLDRLEAEVIEPVVLKLHSGTYIKLVDRRTSDSGIVSLALNITDTIAREAELERARDLALAGERAKSAFLAKMSHELRTPINGVLGMADLLADCALDEDMTLYVDTIKSSGSSILGLVSNVLEYAMLEANDVQLETDTFDLKTMFEQVADRGAEILKDTSVEMVLDLAPDIPAQIIGDSSRLKQVLTNLIENAAKFTDKGHVTLGCRPTGSQTSDMVTLAIAVEDSGVGIDTEMIDHIFGGFNQVEDGSSRAHDGAGLGLSIVKKLTEAMGGDLVVTSTQNVGSKFEITLAFPVVKTANKPQIAKAESPMAQKVIRVLAAEDNKTNQLVFKKMVKDLEIELTLVENGLEAVEAYSAFRPNLIFMDISMPKMDGMEATQKIRWIEAENELDPVTIVAMTAHAMEGDEARIRDCGLDEYLTKPLSKTAITELIEAHGMELPVQARAKVS